MIRPKIGIYQGSRQAACWTASSRSAYPGVADPVLPDLLQELDMLLGGLGEAARYGALDQATGSFQPR